MTRTVLCVDDDRRLCDILSKALGAGGYRVVLAHDQSAAIDAVRDESPDLALLDVMLPGCSGFDVLESIRAMSDHGAQLPALFLTGAARSPAYVERARALRAGGFLKKPIPLDELLTRVRAKLSDAPKAAPSETSYSVTGAAAAPRRIADLESRSLASWLHELHAERANGVLDVRAARRRKQIELRDGHPIGVRSNLLSERFGEWLVRNGRIDGAVFTESTRRLRQRGGQLGEILVAMDALSVDDLALTLRAHSEEKLLELFEWLSGRCEWLAGARLPKASALRRSPAELILGGVRERMPLDRIDAQLKLLGARDIVASDEPFARFQDIELDAIEQNIFDACSRGLSLGAIGQRSPDERRAALGLLEIGFLVPRGGHPGEPSPDSGATAVREEDPQAKRASVAAAGPEPEADHSHYAADAKERAQLTHLLERLEQGNPFDKLGLDVGADEAAIRRAYATIAKQVHPDRFANASETVCKLAEQAFYLVTSAYETLQDPVQLAAYRADPDRDRHDHAEVEEGYRALAAEQDFQRGEARLRARDWAGALEHFEAAADGFPDEGEYHAYSGWAYYLTHGGDPEPMRVAFERMKRGAKLAPQSDKPRLFLGRILLAAGKADPARRMFQRVLEIKPDSVEALRELRLLDMRTPRRAKLVRWLRRRS